MKRALVLLIVLGGCIGGEPIVEEPIMEERDIIGREPSAVERDITAIALNFEDLGDGGWALASENLSVDVYERRFARAEWGAGQLSMIVNRLHLYPDAQSASTDYQRSAQSIKSAITTSSPNVGEASVMWTRGGEGYLLFIRGEIIVELEYAPSGLAEPGFLIDLAEKVDSRIKGEGGR